MDKDCFLSSGLQPQYSLQLDYPIPMTAYNSLFSIQEQTMDSFITSSSDNKLSNELRPSFETNNTTRPITVDQFANNNLPNFPSLVSDPGFAERAAKFSCFGSRSLNGRSSEMGCSKSGRSGTTLMKLPRVWSSPSLKQDGFMGENKNSGQLQVEERSKNGLSSEFDIQNLKRLSGSGVNSNDDSSVTEQAQNQEAGFRSPNGFTSRKRKPLSRGKSKLEAKADDDDNAKRSKQAEGEGNVHRAGKEEGEAKGGNKATSGKDEPTKDYIHVRARRGEATDSHSLAERVRREKISERMKLLQDLVPGCNKVIGKALMLDEIINYVQALQHQVEFLSMKLASVIPVMDVDENNVMSEDMLQINPSLQQQKLPFNASAAEFYSQQYQQTPPLDTNNFSSVPDRQCLADPLNSSTFCSSTGMQLSTELEAEYLRFSEH